MAILNLMLGNKAVQLDTDKPAESQTNLAAAVAEVVTASKAEGSTAKATELQAAVEAGTKSREYIADAIIARYKSAEDTNLNARVADDAKAKEYRDHLLRLPAEHLLSEHKLTAGIKVKTNQIDPANPAPPNPPENPPDELTKLTQRYAAKAPIMIDG